MSEQEFIQAVSECAVKDMGASGILASVSIAQAILESVIPAFAADNRHQEGRKDNRHQVIPDERNPRI